MHNHANTSDLMAEFTTSGFVPTITKPTRVTHTSATLIDNLYYKGFSKQFTLSGIITTDISDHFPTILLREISQSLTPRSQINDSLGRVFYRAVLGAESTDTR